MRRADARTTKTQGGQPKRIRLRVLQPPAASPSWIRLQAKIGEADCSDGRIPGELRDGFQQVLIEYITSLLLNL